MKRTKKRPRRTPIKQFKLSNSSQGHARDAAAASSSGQAQAIEDELKS
ncbi:MAG: hypothetical protein U0520_00915 [Candidatus Saccharimonadales bacterium]